MSVSVTPSRRKIGPEKNGPTQNIKTDSDLDKPTTGRLVSQHRSVRFNIPGSQSTETGVTSSNCDGIGSEGSDIDSDDLLTGQGVESGSENDSHSDGYVDSSDETMDDNQNMSTGEEFSGQDTGGSVGMYVPPHLRGKEGSKEGKDVSRLRKQVQGLINR